MPIVLSGGDADSVACVEMFALGALSLAERPRNCAALLQ